MAKSLVIVESPAKAKTIKRGRFSPSDLGNAVNHILVAAFPDLFDVAFTAKMEDAIDQIETDNLEWVGILSDFYTPFNERLQSVNAKRTELKNSLTEETGETCKNCSKPMVIRWGRNGRFLACSGYASCKNTQPFESADDREIPQTNEVCDKCGEPMVVKKGRHGTF
jgi:DNA topoisomerase-1